MLGTWHGNRNATRGFIFKDSASTRKRDLIFSGLRQPPRQLNFENEVAHRVYVDGQHCGPLYLGRCLFPIISPDDGCRPGGAYSTFKEQLRAKVTQTLRAKPLHLTLLTRGYAGSRTPR